MALSIVLALGLAAPLTARARAAEPVESLRPLAVDLRRLYPELRNRWAQAEAGENAPIGQALRPTSGFLAVIPRYASGTLVVRKGSVEVEQELLGARRSPARAEGSLVRYPMAYPYTEALYIADAGSVEQLFLLTDPHAPSQFVSSVRVRGGRLALEPNGALGVYDLAGEPAMRVGAPRVLDAFGVRRSGHWSVRESRGGRYTVTLGFDARGLAFPVLVE